MAMQGLVAHSGHKNADLIKNALYPLHRQIVTVNQIIGPKIKRLALVGRGFWGNLWAWRDGKSHPKRWWCRKAVFSTHASLKTAVANHCCPGYHPDSR
jgi:hypothetical protein